MLISPSAAPAERPVARVWIFLTAGISLLLLIWYRLPHLPGALFTDEAFYLLEADNLKHGGVPYREIWDNHAPGLVFLLSLLPGTCLHNEASIRLLSAILLGLTAYFVADTLRPLARPWAIFAGSLAFTLYNCLDWFTALYLETEQLMALTLALMVWAACALRRPCLAWFFFGVTLVAKQSGVAFFPLLLVVDGMSNPEWRRPRVRDMLLRAAAAAFPWLAVMAFFSLHHALPELFQGVLFDALKRGTTELHSRYCIGWLRVDIFRPLLPLLGLLLALTLAFPKRLAAVPSAWHGAVLGWAWLLSGLAYLWLQRCGFRHYGTVASPALLLLIAWAAQWLATLWRDALRPAARVLLLLLAAGLTASFAPYLLLLRANRVPPGLPGTSYFFNVREAARALRNRLNGQQLIVIEEHPAWYWYLEQKPPGEVLLPYRLHSFPDQRGKMLQSVIRYGCGRQNLLLYYPSDFAPGYDEIARFRQTTQQLGAHSVNLEAIYPEITAFRPPFNRYADLWDLRSCAPPPVGGSSAEPPPVIGTPAGG